MSHESIKSLIVKSNNKVNNQPMPCSDFDKDTALDGRSSFFTKLSLCSLESDTLSSNSMVIAMSFF